MRRSTRRCMANEILFDTSGFFALVDERDPMHDKAVAWIEAQRKKIRPVSTEWVVGETCTLLVARKRPHLVARFASARSAVQEKCFCKNSVCRLDHEHGFRSGIRSRNFEPDPATLAWDGRKRTRSHPARKRTRSKRFTAEPTRQNS